MAKLRDSTPTAVYIGSNSAEDVASCVSSAWSTKPLHMTTAQMIGGISIQLQQNADGPIVALVDIKPVGANTTAKYYSQLPYDDTWYFEQVKHCMM
ncbi:hypothetical protein [Rhodanobacter sp. C03]|uniref:hypothetical protein n=1 Tax=Rhodanobacter sp. C03 TaxID=1945858 RepID=UPI0011154E94|nr:hypothetical protein [Rhodanobacter sp. C03]